MKKIENTKKPKKYVKQKTSHVTLPKKEEKKTNLVVTEPDAKKPDEIPIPKPTKRDEPYDILFVPCGAFDQREPGICFKDPGWKRKFNRLLRKGYKPAPVGIKNDVLVIWFELKK